MISELDSIMVSTSRRLLSQDRCGEPRATERVPYVIVYGSPGQPLIQLVKQPHEVIPTLDQ